MVVNLVKYENEKKENKVVNLGTWYIRFLCIDGCAKQDTKQWDQVCV